jgi:aspartyl/asparaginyl beta-hydroxylase (cupin superfamily)
VTEQLGEGGEMRRKAMFTVGKTRGVVASLMHRRPFQHMVLRRLRELKKIVPDSRDTDVDMLLQRTAEYICVLELKVAALRRLSIVYGA